MENNSDVFELHTLTDILLPISELFSNFDRVYNSTFTRPSMDMLFVMFTKLLSYRSACAKTRQAALITKDNTIVSFGYNGPPAGKLNCIEFKSEGEKVCGKDEAKSCLNGVHAEQNAIAYSAKHGINITNCSIYITQSPCISCARLISNSGITKVYYLEKYRLEEGLTFLSSLKHIQLQQICL